MSDRQQIRRKSRSARRRGGIIRVVGKRGISFKVKIDVPGAKRTDGKRPTITRTFKTLDQAERELRRLQDQAEKGVRLLEAQTLREWAERWLSETIAGQIGTRAHERYSQLLRQHVLPSLGDTQLRQLRVAEIESLYATLSTSGRKPRGDKAPSGLSPKTITYVHRVLSQCLKDAVRLKHISENPAADVKRPKRKKHAHTAAQTKAPVVKMRILDWPDMTKLLEGFRARALKNAPYPLVLLALDSGARRGELLALRWSDVDLERRTVSIVRAVDETEAYGVTIKDELKNESSCRTVVISAQTASVLRAERERQEKDQEKLGTKLPADALMFPASPATSTVPLPPRFVSKEFSRVARALDFAGMRFHDLRHCCASYLLAAKRPITEVSAHLGHSTPAVTMSIYAHCIPRRESGAGLLDELAATPVG